MMKPEAWIILGEFAVILYLVYRNRTLTDLNVKLERGRLASGEIKYPLTLIHLQQIWNETNQAFCPDFCDYGLHPALFGVKRTLKKLGLTENFEHELRSKIAEMRYSLDLELRQKEILECACSSNGDEASRREAIDRCVKKIVNLTTGLQNAERLLNAWRMV